MASSCSAAFQEQFIRRIVLFLWKNELKALDMTGFVQNWNYKFAVMCLPQAKGLNFLAC